MNDSNNPHKLIASPLSQLAIRFRNSNKSRERDKLFLQIAQHYMPKIMLFMGNVPKHDHEELIQIYHIQVFRALTIWKMQSNFETYLFPYIKSVFRKYMNSAKMFKRVRDTDCDGNVIYRQLNYTLFSDMRDEDILTYDMLEYEEDEEEDDADNQSNQI